MMHNTLHCPQRIFNRGRKRKKQCMTGSHENVIRISHKMSAIFCFLLEWPKDWVAAEITPYVCSKANILHNKEGILYFRGFGLVYY